MLARVRALPATLSPAAARAFFEAEFAPFESCRRPGAAFFTGYYEPEVAGSLVRSAASGSRSPAAARSGRDRAGSPRPRPVVPLRHQDRAAATSACPDRAEIMAGALAGRNLELVWLADPVDAFFIHIQGAARIRLPTAAPCASPTRRRAATRTRRSAGSSSKWECADRRRRRRCRASALRGWRRASAPDDADLGDSGAEPLLHLLPRGAGRRRLTSPRLRSGRRQGAADGRAAASQGRRRPPVMTATVPFAGLGSRRRCPTVRRSGS
jgi:hypothetical protein